MKLKFDKLDVNSKTIRISFDGGFNFNSYNVEELKKNGLEFSKKECRDLRLIRVGVSARKCPSFTQEALDKFNAEPDYINYINLENLTEWLKEKPENTVDNPINLVIKNFSEKNVIDSNEETSIGYPLRTNKTKFVDITETDFSEVHYIYPYAFYGCSNLIYIHLRKGLEEIGDYAFHGCLNLKSISIPETVTYIGEYCFFNCKSLQTIKIPDGVEEINSLSFMNCTSLRDITLPNSIKSIGNAAFMGCSRLTRIYFDGTADDWRKVERGQDWDRKTDENFKVIFKRK